MAGSQTDQAPSVSSVKTYYNAGAGISISSGQISSTITQYTDSNAKSAAVVNSMAGSQTDQAPSVSSVKAYYTAGTGISISSGQISASLASFSIDALSDVDTSTTPPTSGQALAWSSGSSKWIPTTISGGGGDIIWLSDVIANNTILTLSASNSMALVKNGSSAWTVYLPTISGKNGRIIRIKRLGSGLVTIAVNTSDTTKFIDVSGTTSITMGVQYSTFDLVANETDGAWYLL
jgi:hypothetical protein